MSSCSDYEEDFVVDDEGSADDAEAIEKKSSSPFTETQSEIKDRDTSGTDDDENDGGWIFFVSVNLSIIREQTDFISHCLLLAHLLRTHLLLILHIFLHRCKISFKLQFLRQQPRGE